MAGNPARKWWALVAIAASVLVVGLDLTVLNLALPTIATDLHASTSDLQWISDSYSLVLAAAMLPAGLLGDRLGRKKVLLANGREASVLEIQSEYLTRARDFVDRRELHTPVIERALDLWECGAKPSSPATCPWSSARSTG